MTWIDATFLASSLSWSLSFAVVPSSEIPETGTSLPWNLSDRIATCPLLDVSSLPQMM